MIRIRIFLKLLTLTITLLQFPPQAKSSWLRRMASSREDLNKRFIKAAKESNKEELEKLWHEGANPLAHDKDHNTALHYAAAYDEQGVIIDFLLEVAKVPIEILGEEKQTPLHFAARHGNEVALALLKCKGAALDACDENGNTGLHIAAKFDNTGTAISWFLSIGLIFIDQINEDELTPLFCAIERGNKSAFYLLLSKGASVKIKESGNNALHLAAWFDREDMVIFLLEHYKIDVNSRGIKGRTPFMLAIEKGNIYLLMLLKSKGADPCVIDKEGNTPLHIAACFNNRTKISRWLIKICKIGIDTPNHRGETPFHWAARANNLVMLLFLKSKGANVSALDRNGCNALNYACDELVIKFLKKKCKLKPTQASTF